MGIVGAYVQLQRVELAVRAVLVQDLLLLRVDSECHVHNVEAEGTRKVLRALVPESRRLRVLIHQKAASAVE